MTRKDYQLIADELKQHVGAVPSEDGNEAFQLAVFAVANAFSKDNPRFDADRFYAAVYNAQK